MNIRHQVKTFITSAIAPDVAADELPDDYDLIDGGVMSSLAIVRLIAWIGSTYAVPINDLDLSPQDFSTIARIEHFIIDHGQTAAV